MLIMQLSLPSILQQGFAVLTITVVLSLAAIMITMHMVHSQLIANHIIANHFRHNEAFGNAESGVHYALSLLDDSDTAQDLLSHLPAIYESSSKHYQVIIEEIGSRRLAIRSDATSMDGSAQRQVNLEVDFFLHFPIPDTSLAANGQLYLGEGASLNNGCEGLTEDNCSAASHIAKHLLISNPAMIQEESDFCAQQALLDQPIETSMETNDSFKAIASITDENGETHYDWGNIATNAGSNLVDLTPARELAASTLFEASFALSMNEDNLVNLWENALQIDMTGGGDCSAMLQEATDQDRIIYIKGDCDISDFYAEQSQTQSSEIVTVGSVEHPKLVFIEGGTFTAPEGVQASIVGLLYYLPATHDVTDDQGNFVDLLGQPLEAGEEVIQQTDSSVALQDVVVNGALLSEYRCSYGGYNNAENLNMKPFSARFDRLVLETLYEDLGFTAIGSGYRLVPGSWRDF